MLGSRGCLLASADPPAALEVMIDAARAGVASAGGTVIDWERGPPPVADAFLFAAPIVLFGLPGLLKTRLDEWIGWIPRGEVIPRTAGRSAGYLATYAPDDPALLESVDAQLRGIIGFLGMVYRGRAASFAGPGAAQPKSASEVHVARNLGSVLARNQGFAGWPVEYLKGIELYNAGQHWQAHEAWEDLWIREEGDCKLFYQGLIQVTAAFHHYGHSNWPGMRKLLKDGMAKLERFRPFAQGLDVDAFLLALRPWRLLALARTGEAETVTRIPDAPPRIELRGTADANPGDDGKECRDDDRSRSPA